MKNKLLLMFAIVLLILPSAMAYTSDYLYPLTRSIADKIYCAMNAPSCIFLGNITFAGDVHFIGEIVNITVHHLIINSTEVVGLNDSIDDRIDIFNNSFLQGEHWVNETGDDVEWLNVNDNLSVDKYIAHIGDSDTYFDFRDDYIRVYSGGLFFLGLYESALIDYLYLGHDDDIQVRIGKDTIWVNESNNQVDFSGCIELNDKLICSWDDINTSIGDINISEGVGEHWVNETYEIGNQTFAQIADGKDVELRLETDTNERAYLYYMESDSDILGFRTWYDGHGGGTYKIDAIDGAGVIIPKFEIDRDDNDADFFVNIDVNDNNFTNVQCIELNNEFICDWSSVNQSIGDINISEGTGEHWWNDTDVESANYSTTGTVTATNTTTKTLDVTGSVSVGGTVEAEHLSSTDDVYITDKLGIGRNPQYYSFEMGGANTGVWVRRITDNAGTGRAPFFWFWRAQGTPDSPTRVVKGSQLFKIQASGLDVDGTGFGSLGYINEVRVDGSVATGSMPTNATWATSAAGSGVPTIGMVMKPGGKMVFPQEVNFTEGLNVGENITKTIPTGANIECIIQGDNQCLFGMNSTCTFQYSTDGSSVTEVCNA